jgi:hypothetical protein
LDEIFSVVEEHCSIVDIKKIEKVELGSSRLY